MQLPDLLESDIEKLEHWMDVMDEQLPALTAFVLPGGHLNAAHAHVARCISRRAERMVVTLDELEGVEALVLMYLNRLSDYLFVLSRKMSQDKGATEHTWTPLN
jgi:cob(I)alamin adenosyltransferase